MESDDEIDHDIVSSVPPQDIPLDNAEAQENHIILQWIVTLLLFFQSKFSISDAAITWLLKFLYALLKLLGTFSNQVCAIADGLPHSGYHLKNSKLRPQCDAFEKYNVCIKCNSLYTHEECAIISKCSFKQFHNSRRCGEALLKEIVSANGSRKSYPHKMFCLSRLSSSLQNLALKPGFIEKCESTRNMFCSSGLSDVFDGRIWKIFQEVDNKPFLSAQHNYGLLLNIDWLQPFEHTTHSVGVIFLVVLNLPCSIRFKRENVILYGIIPGPTEPSLNINTFIAPLVSDLLDLWKGIELQVPYSSSTVMFRCALLGVACDLPAAKKTCGFLSHSATLGCSKCYYRFFDGHGNANYGGDFEREKWQLQSNSKHRADIKKVCQCSTKTSRAKAEMELGCRYSALLDLPYFDPITTMMMIDPMHNLFLGTAKHFMFNILIGRNILDKKSLEIVKLRLSRVVVPTGLGRLPSTVNTGTFLTATQWMNWTIYFSIYCLNDLIPKNQVECWRHFVLACCRLCKFQLSQDDLSVADALLLQFCKRVKNLFGVNAHTPNMHMHCHVVRCMKDFGPAHSFWLFPFECYNGILGSQPTNNRSVEVQLMRRFHTDNTFLSSAKNMQFSKYFNDLVEDSRCFTDDNTGLDIKLGSKYLVSTLSVEFKTIISKLYTNLYPNFSEQFINGSIYIPSLVHKYPFIIKNGTRIHSLMRQGAKNPYVLASPVF